MTTDPTGHHAVSSEGVVTVTETGSGTYTQQIDARHHQLVADEPQPIGDDTGPTCGTHAFTRKTAPTVKPAAAGSITLIATSSWSATSTTRNGNGYCSSPNVALFIRP